MRRKDLIELLGSAIDGGSIVSLWIHFFHLSNGYSIEELKRIVEYGVGKGYFVIENVDDQKITYEEVIWDTDNLYQEVLLNDYEKYIPILFSIRPSVPKEFEQFVTEENLQK